MPRNCASWRSPPPTSVPPARRLTRLYTRCRRLRRTAVRSGHDTGLLGHDRSDGCVFDTTAESDGCCIDRPTAWIVTGQSPVWCFGIAGTTHGLRTDIARRSSWYKRRDCWHQCPERPIPRPVETPVHRQKQSQAVKLGRCRLSRRTTTQVGPDPCAWANLALRQFPAEGEFLGCCVCLVDHPQ
ncbi:MAG: hypothetical protein J07HN6_00200 [Halonotius sp. J07HN6]|nr:MAG: hypothetical protein J07HN6_00200 [Halonotius sp. J07HN6]